MTCTCVKWNFSCAHELLQPDAIPDVRNDLHGSLLESFWGALDESPLP